MNKFIIFVMAMIFILPWAHNTFNKWTWKYRITVEIETPEGIKSGSAVRQVTTFRDISFKGNSLGTGGSSTTGEAVVIDLDTRGVLFVTTSGGDDAIFYKAFPRSGGGSLTREGMEYYSSLEGDKISLYEARVLNEKSSLQFVRFRNLNDPMTVELVKGYVFDISKQEEKLIDNFEMMFGVGVKIKDITIEKVDKSLPVTRKVDEYLPWLSVLSGGYLDGQFSGGGSELSNRLHGGNFKSGAMR